MSEDITSGQNLWAELIAPIDNYYSRHRTQFTHLAHYCSFASLEGIIQNKELWFSPVALMNDYKEVSTGQRILIDEFKDGGKLSDLITPLKENFQETLQALDEEFQRRIESDWAESFISCWSMIRPDNEDIYHPCDNLTMWRGYASEGNGVCIIANPTEISPVENAHRSEIIAVPVFYETRSDFVERARGALSHYFNHLSTLSDEMRSQWKWLISSAFGEICFVLAITHKHQGFDAEREWRFIWRRAHNLNGEGLERHVKPKLNASGLFERFCLPLCNDPEITPGSLEPENFITGILIGPCDQQYFKKRAVVNLLRSNGFEDAESIVRVSGIPFRR